MLISSGIIIACGKPLMAKLADVFGRGETYIFVAVLYAIGYVRNCSTILLLILQDHHGFGSGCWCSCWWLCRLRASSIRETLMLTPLQSFGYTGLQLLSVIVIADMTTLRFRGFGSSMLTLPFVINSFVSAEIAQGVLTGAGWRWGYGMVSPSTSC